MAKQNEGDVTTILKQLYSEYKQTRDIDARSRFFSPQCRQICRPNPSFAARDRDTIMRYLHETSGKDAGTIQALAAQEEQDASRSDQARLTTAAAAATAETPAPDLLSPRATCDDSAREEERKSSSSSSYYTIRPLRDDEAEFGADDVVRPAGFASAAEAERLAQVQGWVGMRVDLWDDDGGPGGEEEEEAGGIMVKVQYWWRREGDDGQWLQILHDIMYLGPRDGTEGSEGEIIEQP